MKYEDELAAGNIKAVYNNFLVDVEMPDGSIEAAFCGVVEAAEICKEGALVLLQVNAPDRIVKYNVHFVKTHDGWVMVNPKYNRRLFVEALAAKKLSDFSGCRNCRHLKPSEAQGIDFELSDAKGEKTLVYVTSIYHKKGRLALFPHNIDFFEARMLEEMRIQVAKGNKACVVLIVPRDDCDGIKFSWDINPQAAGIVYDAVNNGVKFVGYSCKIEENSIELVKKMDIEY